MISVLEDSIAKENEFKAPILNAVVMNANIVLSGKNFDNYCQYQLLEQQLKTLIGDRWQVTFDYWYPLSLNR